MKKDKIVLEAEDISVSFRMYDKGLTKHDLTVIKKMNVTVHEGEILAIVGASGSGKSVLAHAVLGILPSNASVGGEIRYCGDRLTDSLRKEKVGSEIIMIPQSVTYLDPLMKAGKQVRGLKGTRKQLEEAFRRYGLDKSAEKKYPFQLSGGMARRVLISTAVISDAKLILADEPTPGLSEDMADETMRHFRELADKGCGILMITHDIETALKAADTIAVFYDGQTIDYCTADDFRKGRDALKHPYTKALWSALPENGFVSADVSEIMKGAL